LERANRAVALGAELEHPFTLAYALFHCGFLHLWRREAELVRARALAALEVADEHELTIWKAVGTCLLGVAQTELGRWDEGLAGIQNGIALYRGLRTPPIFWPLLLYLRAYGCGQSGEAIEGLRFIDEALEVAGANFTLAPELYRLKGELLFRRSEGDRSAAEDWLLRAYERGRELGTRMPQLRAAIDLCHVQREQDNREQCSQLLAAVYATFTEGFTTRDLLEARDRLHDAPHDSATS
jgi:adenylate cyclase